MSRLNQFLLWLGLFVMNFVFYLALMTSFLMVSLHFSMQEALGLLVGQYNDLPIILYVLVGCLLISSVLTLIVVLKLRMQQATNQLQLQALLEGQYDDDILNTENKFSNIEQTIEQLRQKMIRLQREIQNYNDGPKVIVGQTKEAILKQERHRLARELHDSVSQQLFAAMMMLSATTQLANQQQANGKLLESLKMIEQVINNAQSEMRALLLHLRPNDLQGKQLKEGLIQLLNELKTKVNLAITWDIDRIELPSNTEDHLFRIAQELLSNTLRHAKATSLEVYFKQIGQTVLLKVVDDGIGFDSQQAANPGSYGLTNIKERAASIGADVKVVSLKNQGSSIEIKLPLLKE